MNTWILDEEKLTMELITTGRVEGKLYDKYKSATRRISKYYLLRGYSIEKTIDMVKRWFGECVKFDFLEDSKIRELTNQSYGCLKSYVKIDNIEIKKSEMEVIKGLPTKNLQKLAFGFLVYAKVLNIRYGGYFVYGKKINQLFVDSNANYTGKKQMEQINKLVELGLLEIDMGYKHINPSVLFVGQDTEETVFTIYDFELLGLQLLKYLGDTTIKLKHCEYCGKLMQVKDSRTKYHDECKKYAKRDKERDRQREKRKVSD